MSDINVSTIDEARITSSFRIDWGGYQVPITNPESVITGYSVYYTVSTFNTVLLSSISNPAIKNCEHSLYNMPFTSTSLISSILFAPNGHLLIEYKVVAKLEGPTTKDNLSFIVLPHVGAFQCRATKAQVHDNILYNEGEAVWFSKLSDSNTTYIKDNWKTMSRVNVDASSLNVDLSGHVLVGIGTTNDPSDNSRAVRATLTKGNIETAFQYPRSGSTYREAIQATTRGLITHPLSATRMLLATNDTDTLQRPIMHQVTVNSAGTIIDDLPQSYIYYDAGTQIINMNGAKVFCYGSVNSRRTINGVKTNLAIMNFSRMNVAPVNIDTTPITSLPLLWRKSDSGLSSDSKTATHAFYGMASGPDGRIFISSNRYANNSPSEPARLIELSNRLENSSLTRAQLPTSPEVGVRLRGLATDSRITRSINGYNVWACSDKGQAIVKYTWSNNGFLNSYKKYNHGNTTGNAVASMFSGCAADVNNNMWFAGTYDALFKVYNEYGDSPYRFETDFNLYDESPYNNNKYISFFLTRDPWAMTNVAAKNAWYSLVVNADRQFTQIATTIYGEKAYYETTTGGITVKGDTLAQKISNAYNWLQTYYFPNNPYGIIGRIVNPYYYNKFDLVDTVGSSVISGYVFSKTYSTNALYSTKKLPLADPLSNIYSDFSGAVQAQYGIYSDAAGSSNPQAGSEISPTDVAPTLSFEITNGSVENPLGEDTWGVYTNGNSVTAFDNFSMGIRPIYTNGSYILSTFKYFTGDYLSDYGGTMNVTVTSTSADAFYHIYHDPNKHDWISRQRDGRSVGDTQVITVSVEGYWYKDGETSPSFVSAGNVVPVSSVTVLERWPTAVFHMSAFDLSSVRQDWYGLDKWGNTHQRSVTLSSNNNMLVISGTEPLSCQIFDTSIARTWPISAWSFDSKCDPYVSALFVDNRYVYYTNVDTTTAYSDFATPAIQLSSYVYRKPGTYYPTLYVQASNSGTFSNEIGALSSTNIVYVAASCRVDVLEYPPNVNFLILSGTGYDETYRDTMSGTIVNVSAMTNNDYISGYSPNLTVIFKDSAEPHSYYIQKWDWNFGDYYNETNNYFLITSGPSNISEEYPYWTNDNEGHNVSHTYVMPGYYNVSLTVTTISSNSETVSAKNMVVYLEEIPPEPCLQMGVSANSFGSLSAIGYNELTVYFNPSCTIAGSFPICRIDYDFGDGSPIYTQNVYETGLSATVSHTYTTNFGDSVYNFYPTITVYACNTNTSEVLESDLLITVVPPITSSLPAERRHLIANRLADDTLILAMEGDTTKTLFNYALSSTENAYLSSL